MIADNHAERVMKRTAVVVVHGMGEQRPMDTLWSFVEALWINDETVVAPKDNEVFSTPEDITGSFELRRLTTRHGLHGRRVDFFEFYWAHLMTGNTMGGVWSWLWTLIGRSPLRVPPYLKMHWMAIWSTIVLAGAAGLVIMAVFKTDWWWTALVLPAAAFGWTFFQQAFLAPVLGDAARYLSAKPDNVAARQAIRQAAIDLIEALHRKRRAYDRIIVVGHSLGTVVAYDALNYAWGRIDKGDLIQAHRPGSPAHAALRAVEAAAGELKTTGTDVAQGRFRDAQRAYCRALAQCRRADKSSLWLVSDFVTTGSPLSKADLLMARDTEEFLARRRRREYATSPPWPDKATGEQFSYKPAHGSPAIPHHASVFGPTVWTNIYFRDRWFAFGDVIAGPIAEHFGRGIRDLPLAPGWSFRHLHYWTKSDAKPTPPWIDKLRRAVNLAGKNEDEIW